MSEIGRGHEPELANGSRAELQEDQLVSLFLVTGPGTYSVRCGPRDQYRPRQNPLSQAMPLPSPATAKNRSAGPAAS